MELLKKRYTLLPQDKCSCLEKLSLTGKGFEWLYLAKYSWTLLKEIEPTDSMIFRLSSRR